MRRAEAGFTLLEILVALVVLGFLIAGMAQATRLGLQVWQTQGRTLGAQEELDSADRTLRHLIGHMFPGTAGGQSDLQAGPAAMAFTTDLPLFAGPDRDRMADVAILVDGAHRLVLRWAPHRHDLAAGSAAPAQETELLRGVRRAEFAYFGRLSRDAPLAWRQSWDGTLLPALVRIRLVFEDAPERRWPDIVAATMRERPGE